MQEKKKQSTQDAADEETTQSTVDEEAKEKLDDDVDGLLAEIDAVLEVNAAEFVKAYIQKGGQ